MSRACLRLGTFWTSPHPFEAHCLPSRNSLTCQLSSLFQPSLSSFSHLTSPRYGFLSEVRDLASLDPDRYLRLPCSVNRGTEGPKDNA